MKVKWVKVNGFRNLATQTVTLGTGLNLFIGNNAQGKTNLLESVYLCCLGKSVRTDHDRDMIGWDKPSSSVMLNYDCIAGSREIEVKLLKDKKSILINDTPIMRIGELLGYFNCIYFSPEEIRVITSSPIERRRFLDIDLCQLDKEYYRSLVKFNKILLQRNNLLKQSNHIDSLRDMLSIWDTQLARAGAIITYKRKQFCDSLAPYVEQAHAKLTKTETLSIQYLQSISGNDLDTINANYLAKLTDSIDKDYVQRFTTVGCQRDDIKFSVNGIDIRTFGSQGQQRTAALSLKLAELELFYNIKRDYPVLLLDDVLSELDRSRQKALLNFSTQVQILLTTTKIDNNLIKNIDVTRLRLKCGKVN
ncbi:MAG: DNA replication/repair protein RecF [Clostridia bacterium]|nr:DNA replication/repair protein RecF [Clostridia bacterium]